MPNYVRLSLPHYLRLYKNTRDINSCAMQTSISDRLERSCCNQHRRSIRFAKAGHRPERSAIPKGRFARCLPQSLTQFRVVSTEVPDCAGNSASSGLEFRFDGGCRFALGCRGLFHALLHGLAGFNTAFLGILPQGLLKHLKERMRHLCSRKRRHVVNDEEGNSL